MKTRSLSAIFAAAVLLTGCDDIHPLKTDPSPKQGVSYQTYMVRHGCEVGAVVTGDNKRRVTSPVVLCPKPGTTEVVKDAIAEGVEYTPLYTRFGCEVGNLRLGFNSTRHTIILCPETGEGAINQADIPYKGGKKPTAIHQYRP